MERTARLQVRVIPRAGRTVLAGRRGDAWLIRLAAAPVDGAANEALVEFLSAVLGCPRRNITVASGLRSRDKRLDVAGLTQIDLDRRLAAAASPAT
jgi:uncharacterized protein YggU (UPF0235/DUF167 family)